MKTLGKFACAVALASCLVAAGCSSGGGDVQQNPPKDDSVAPAGGAGDQKEGASLTLPAGEYALVTLSLPNMS